MFKIKINFFFWGGGGGCTDIAKYNNNGHLTTKYSIIQNVLCQGEKNCSLGLPITHVEKLTCISKLTLMVSVSAVQRVTDHRWSPISFHYTISLNADWAGPMGKRTIWKFEQGPALDSMLCSLAHWNLLYSHSVRRRMERNWGSHHWNASLCAADSLMAIVIL